MQALHITDSVNTCDCCGKSGLKVTVAMLTDAGEVVHYGTTCAARNSGKSPATINPEISARAAALAAKARAEYLQCPEYLAECAAFAERARVMPGVVGRAAADFVRPQVIAANAARARIIAAHGVSFTL